MAVNSNVETLTNSPDRDQRRHASLALFREYLSARPKILADLGYSPDQQKYVLGPINNLTLPHHMTNHGLEARPSIDSTGTGPASLLESPAKGVAQFEATLPSNLGWHSRDRLNDAEMNALKEMGALLRMRMLDTSLLEDGGEAAIVKALHVGDRLPRMGLREAGVLSHLARLLGQAATFDSKRLNGIDIAMGIQSPGKSVKNEVWRELFSDNRLHVFGSVPQIKS